MGTNFTRVLAVVWGGRFVYALSYRLAEPNWLRAGLRTQWVATLGLLPLTVYLFQQTSLVSPLANAVAIPVISLAVVPLTLLGAVLPIDAALHAAHWLMQLTMTCLQALSALDFSVWHFASPQPWQALVAMAGVLVLLLPRGFPIRWLGGLMLLTLLVPVPSALPYGAMQVAVLDVGQGLAVLVNTAQHHLLYDTGRVIVRDINSGNRVIQPYLFSTGVNQLDMMVVSHHDSDHYGGMESLLQRIPTQQLLTSFDLPIDVSRKLQQQLYCQQGQTWQWDGVRFEVLYPNAEMYQSEVSDNNKSCVIKVTAKSGAMLLTGDIEALAEQRL
jgi:competence protein ComEC